MLLDEATSGVEARSKVGAFRRYALTALSQVSCLVETISGSQTEQVEGTPD